MTVLKLFVVLLSIAISEFILCIPAAQSDTSGFTNIDCGLPQEKESYLEKATGLRYVSDSAFITGGESRMASPEYTSLSAQHLTYVRSFPRSKRNCYNIPLVQGATYLLRAVFCYLNYDGRAKMPAFDLYLDNDKWETVEISGMSFVLNKEIVHTASRNNVFVCLVNTGSGTPFISALEARKTPFLFTEYPGLSLGLFYRLNLGSGGTVSVRYPDDEFDRIWTPLYMSGWANITTNQSTINTTDILSKPPAAVMRSAITPSDPEQSIKFPAGLYKKYVFYLYFAELVKLQPNQLRLINIYAIDELYYSNLSPDYLSATHIYPKKPIVRDLFLIELKASQNSTLPPILNAIELYYVVNVSFSLTEQEDVDALQSIKSAHNISENWEGDPCGPQNYPWNRITCSYANSTPSAVVSLDLSSMQLRGEIAKGLANMKNLQILDLSNNSLTGSVPGFLSLLPSLKVLKLSGNNLTGTIPDSIAARSKAGSLSLSVTGNPNLCLDETCAKSPKKQKSKKNLVLVVVAVLAALAIASVFACIFLWWKKKRSKGQARQGKAAMVKLISHARSLPHSSIAEITSNFQTVIGEGGSGKVYYGVFGEAPVAVKTVSASDEYQQFQTEANHLLKVHHRNLTRLVGYCNEEGHLALVYEYMANGSLREIISYKNKTGVADESKVLSWKQRLQIAIDSAQGLEYLHHHCEPPIIHRDIKSANILLDAQFGAKISDFGFSKASPLERTDHTTVVIGTAGYLDPEYLTTCILTTKSDVYSFGIVLLELITGRNPSHSLLYGWVEAHLRNGDIKSIVEPKLNGEFNDSGAWMMVELAMDCASRSSTTRPSMLEVVSRLQGCKQSDVTESSNFSYVPAELSSPQLR